MIFITLILNLLNAVHCFNALYFHEIHDKVVQVLGTMDIEVYVSDEDSIVTGQINRTHMYRKFLGDDGGDIIINTKFVDTLNMYADQVTEDLMCGPLGGYNPVSLA